MSYLRKLICLTRQQFLNKPFTSWKIRSIVIGKTRKYSSRMRTIRSNSRLLAGGYLPGRVSAWEGMSTHWVVWLGGVWLEGVWLVVSGWGCLAGGCLLRGVCLRGVSGHGELSGQEGGCLGKGSVGSGRGCLLGGVYWRGCLPWGQGVLVDTPLTPSWTEWLTDRCENITLPQLLW